jgi:hypothetical protein
MPQIDLASWSSPSRAVFPSGAQERGAVDRDDGRRIRNDKVNDLLARHAALEHQDPAVIDDRGVEALPLSAHINADPWSHKSKHAAPTTSARCTDAEDRAGPRLPSARPQLHGRAQCRRGTRPVGVSSELWSDEIAGGSAG